MQPPEPWRRQLAELDAVYPTRIQLAVDLGVCTATLSNWLAGGNTSTLYRISVGELHAHIHPAEAVEQTVIIARQALDAVLEMMTLEMAHVQARRGLEALAGIRLNRRS